MSIQVKTARMILTIDHVQLAIPEGGEDLARAFWTGRLQCPEIEKPAMLRPRGGVWFKVGDRELHLGTEKRFVPARKAHPGFIVSSCREIAERLKEDVVWDQAIPERTRLFASDPFGNRLEFIEAPS